MATKIIQVLSSTDKLHTEFTCNGWVRKEPDETQAIYHLSRYMLAVH